MATTAGVYSDIAFAGEPASLYASNPLQEIFRDMTAASAHLSLSWHRSAPYYGQIRLGLPVDFDTL